MLITSSDPATICVPDGCHDKERTRPEEKQSETSTGLITHKTTTLLKESDGASLIICFVNLNAADLLHRYLSVCLDFSQNGFCLEGLQTISLIHLHNQPGWWKHLTKLHFRKNTNMIYNINLYSIIPTSYIMSAGVTNRQMCPQGVAGYCPNSPPKSIYRVFRTQLLQVILCNFSV